MRLCIVRQCTSCSKWFKLERSSRLSTVRFRSLRRMTPIGIWPSGSGLPHVKDMVRHIDYVKKLVGIDHVGIGSDLRGMRSYSDGFGDEARFEAIREALRQAGYSDPDVSLVMGGNFFRVWEEVTR